MTKAKKARSAALSARVNAAKLKKELHANLAHREGQEARRRKFIRAFVIASKGFWIRQKLGLGGSCMVKLDL